MSDGLLRVIPVDPEFCPGTAATDAFCPGTAATDAAESLLRSFLPNAERVTAKPLAGVEFVDAGANWEGVRCSACGADAEPWWGDAMSQASDTGFHSLFVLSGCCRQTVSLNELRYGWPVGFASFIHEVRSPASKGLTTEQLAKLGGIVGCAVRQIPVHL